MVGGLIIVLLLVLILPFTEIVGRNLEVFIFFMGIISVLISQVVGQDLIKTAITAPLSITLAVFIAGLLFRWFQKPIARGIIHLSYALPYKLFIALFVIILGIVSSIITAIIAAIILVAVVTVLQLDRKSEIRLVILACYSIGLGAALTPLGEPLSIIVVSKLNEDFFYLLKLLGIYIIPGILAFGVLAGKMVAPRDKSDKHFQQKVRLEKESYDEIIIRSIKIYLFVVALTLLGAGFQPLIEMYLLDLHPLVLYWVNIVSAILDNATLAAAEISPQMNESTIKAILLGLIISGGMLIPGNIPNIIAAGKLKITSLEYARFAVPVGFIGMLVYSLILMLIL